MRQAHRADDAGPDDPGDPPCAVCGCDPAGCECPECPVCGAAGDPKCYQEHGLEEPEGDVYCHECSKAGGADMPVYHLPPACKPQEING